jgi:predicted Zn-ribbon and HTH transcriptional regulator
MDESLFGNKCLRCGHEWMKRIIGTPVQCPKCKSTLWNQDRSGKKVEEKE